MKLDTFFEKFALFAEAPGAVARLKDLIVDLGVTGRLLDHTETQVTGQELLALTRAERQALEASQTIRRRSARQISTEDELCVLPETWAWGCLADAGHELGQKAPDEPFTYIDVGSIDAATGCISEEISVLAPDGAPSRARKRVERGTVIYSTVRPYLRNVAIVDRKFDPEPIASTAFGILHPFAGVESRYLFFWLRSTPFSKYVQSTMKGVAYPAISDQAFYAGPIALPPTDEQKRIVAKVDELMALCDRLEAQQQERETQHAALSRAALARFAEDPTPANLEWLFHASFGTPTGDLRQSILALAVQGKLVSRDLDDKLVADSDALVVEKRDQQASAGHVRKGSESVPITNDKLPFAVPTSWAWVRLSNLARRIHYGYTAPAKKDLHNVRLLRITDIQNNTVDWASVPGCEIDNQTVGKYILEQGDILVARTGGTVGKTYLVQEIPVTAVFASYLIRIKPGPLISSRYLKLFLESPTYWSQLEAGARGAAQPNVNGQTLGRMVVSVPPLLEQRRIVAKVDELMALVDQLEARQTAARAAATRLLNAAVAELTA